MKEIILTKLSLTNFKGIRSLEIDFGRKTDIRGANASGKTTVFDAFRWLLFGKSSDDRKDFGIKTYDEQGNVIPRIPHEVTGVLRINGEEITLRKCLVEKWTKKRGSAEETYSGNLLECYWNDVPTSVTEYNAKISGICDEQLFKLITNPWYFTAQKKDVQRAMLFDLAGNIDEEDIVGRNEDFAALLRNLTGKTLDEYKREIVVKKRRVKDSVESIPARIDECNRSMPEARDWDAIEQEIDKLQSEVSAIDTEIADINKANEMRLIDVSRMKQDYIKKASAKADAENEIINNAHREYYEKKRAYEAVQAQAKTLRNERQLMSITIPRLEHDLQTLKTRHAELLNEWYALKNEQFVAPDRDMFVCPTCGQKLKADDIDARIEQMRNAFNSNHADKLEDNKQKGLENKAAITAKESELKSANDKVFAYDADIAEIENSDRFRVEPIEPDYQRIVAEQTDIKAMREDLQALSDKIRTKEAEAGIVDTDAVYKRKQELLGKIAELKTQMQVRDIIGRTLKRIAELEDEYRTQQNALAELEKTEYTIQQFRKAQIEHIEERINRMFEIVKFKMFEKQVNGEEVETCEAMVNGVPFSDLNDAKKMNAGIDIINTICREKKCSAPIVIDNRESVTSILPTQSQIINLIVDSQCSTLKIERDEKYQ